MLAAMRVRLLSNNRYELTLTVLAATSNYMSNGFCQDHCQGSYVFAIIQGQNCWCSNEQPANTVSNSQCSVQCPGYPSETCGNAAQGLFAYFNLGGNPTGTYGGSSPSSSTPPTSSSSSSVSTYTQPTTVTVTSSSSGFSSTGRSRYSWTLSTLDVSVLTSDVISQSYAEPSTSSLSTSTVSETKSLATTLLSTSLPTNTSNNL